MLCICSLCAHVSIRVCLCVCLCMYPCVSYASMYMCIYVHLCLSVCICLYVHPYMWLCVLVCVCVFSLQGKECDEGVLRAQNEDFTLDRRPQVPIPADGAVGTSLKEVRLWVCWRLRKQLPCWMWELRAEHTPSAWRASKPWIYLGLLFFHQGALVLTLIELQIASEW